MVDLVVTTNNGSIQSRVEMWRRGGGERELVLQAAPSIRKRAAGREERSERCFVVNTFYDPSLTRISSEHFRGKLIFLKKNV